MVRSLIPWGSLPQPLDTFRREMDSLFDRYLGFVDDRSTQMYDPAVDIAETENGYEVSLELPGLKADDFSVEIQNGDLWITGEKKDERERNGRNFHTVERRYGQFRRVISLDSPVDADHVTAEYKDGVLSIHVPKTEAAKPHATSHADGLKSKPDWTC